MGFPKFQPVPLEHRVLPLSEPLFAQTVLCFLDARSRSLRFEHKFGVASGFRVSNWSCLEVRRK
jgi:hypothetical protein